MYETKRLYCLLHIHQASFMMQTSSGAHMGWWGGCPGSWEAQGGFALPSCTICSLGNAVQCRVVTVKIDIEMEDLSPFGFTLFFFLFQHLYLFLRQVKLDKLKEEIKRLHGCVLALNSKNRLFNFSLWTVRAISVSLRTASCLHETYSLCIFWCYDSLASFNQNLQNTQFSASGKKSRLWTLTTPSRDTVSLRYSCCCKTYRNKAQRRCYYRRYNSVLDNGVLVISEATCPQAPV